MPISAQGVDGEFLALSFNAVAKEKWVVVADEGAKHQLERFYAVAAARLAELDEDPDPKLAVPWAAVRIR